MIALVRDIVLVWDIALVWDWIIVALFAACLAGYKLLRWLKLAIVLAMACAILSGLSGCAPCNSGSAFASCGPLLHRPPVLGTPGPTGTGEPDILGILGVIGGALIGAAMRP